MIMEEVNLNFVSFPYSDFSKRNKKTPEVIPQEFF